MALPSADTAVDADGDASLLQQVDESTALMRERRRFTHTTEAQRRCVVEWLEQPPNFQLLARGMPPVLTPDGRKLKKADGFRALTRHVNARTGAEWDVETTRSRYESLLHTFHKARRAVESPDFAVTTTDRSRGVTEARQKRDALCLFYDRLDALFRTGVALPGVEREPSDSKDSPVAVSDARHESLADAAGAAVAAAAAAVASAEASAPPGLPVKEELTRLEAGAATPPLRAAASTAAPPPKRARLAPPTGVAAVGTAVSRRASYEPSSAGFNAAHTELRRAIVESNSTAPDSGSRRASVEPSPIADLSSRSSVGGSSCGVGADEGVALDEDTKDFSVEAQKLALQQERLQLQRRELDLREQELAAQESMRKQSLRADLTAKLVAAGKSLGEIREYLALLEG